MKIALVGKGGSGKTTLATQAVLHLLAQGTQVLALDADINIHFAQSLGVTIDPQRALSRPENARDIRRILRGSNTRIADAASFVKTTPPGNGSHLIRVEMQDPVLKQWGVPFHSHGVLMHVGTYEEKEIGTSCYHSNLTIAENVLSHTVVDQSHWVVADMVAGTDAFSGSMHLQFDVIVLVVEPTPEGVAVFQQYRTLSMAAGVWDRVLVVGNKVESTDDEEYLRRHLGGSLTLCIPTERRLRQAGQQGIPVGVLFTEKFVELFDRMRGLQQDADVRLSQLYALHRRHATEDYIVARCGDVTDQIDPTFTFGQR